MEGLEKRRLMVNTGPSSSPSLHQFGVTHPFIQQLDVVFPSSDDVEMFLSILEPTYHKGEFTLSELYENALTVDWAHEEHTFMAVPTQNDSDDTWCVDYRGFLTLSVSKPIYERIGLVGKKLPFKGYAEHHVIRIPLREQIESVAVRARQKAALKIWDDIRAEAGYPKWQVLHCNGGAGLTPDELKPVRPQVERYTDVHIPIPTISPCPSKYDKDGEALDDWNENARELFEWVGMAALGAQRLKANDRVDPYVAVYEPPAPSRIGSATHMSWTGLLHPVFVQTVATINASSSPNAAQDSTEQQMFVSVMSHAYPWSPVSYIAPSALEAGAKSSVSGEAPLRACRIDAEDTTCLLFIPPVHDGMTTDEDSSESECCWMKVESVGQWDTRWG
ncbi:hypothetical protein SERLA73DRAFT_57918 [Serpula lacrymans var. lacrymans S7.3]|uniref:Uncharacterized protein n=1 Tax=Serpula lacrymans var. lacrymans (strain S7.3) TaxID=936435 RepID=F8Q410_SERL3|nr:hypothetical protein SERLA73DRAFT_57918 [Serpula lacrymans var. lacrymans S7.3]